MIITNKITGAIVKNKLTKIGTVNVSANTGYQFRDTPSLKLSNISGNIVKLKQTNVTRNDDNNITGYSFDLLFKNSDNINDNITVYIIYNASIIRALTRQIKDVLFDTNTVSDLGEKRTIKVIGDVNAEFDLTITKDSDGLSILDSTLKPNGLLSSSFTNNKVLTSKGLIPCFTKKITKGRSKSGTASCSFNQFFPRRVIRSTTLNGAMDNSVTMNVADNDDVAVGDRVIMGQVKNGTVIKVLAVNPGSVDNRLTLTEAITAPNAANVSFIRKDSYSINIYPKPETTLGSRISTLEPQYSIKQHIDPILTLKATSSHATSNPADIIYVGKPNAYAAEIKDSTGAVGSTMVRTDKKNHFKISYSLTASSGNWERVGANLPKWSSTNSANSSWTNSLYNSTATTPSQHYTHIEIFNIVLGGMGTSTATITADVIIKKWGTEDVTMTLDIDPVTIDGA